MRTVENEFVQKLKQYQRLPWIQQKQIGNMNMSYTQQQGLYWKGEITLNNLIQLTLQIDDKVQFFRNEKSIGQDGILTDTYRFRNQLYILKYKAYCFKINEQNLAIYKQFNNSLEQLIHCKLQNNKTYLTIIYYTGHQTDKKFIKFIKESIINYSCLENVDYFEKQSHLSELRTIDDQNDINKYVCNFIDTCDYQPQETDAQI